MQRRGIQQGMASIQSGHQQRMSDLNSHFQSSQRNFDARQAGNDRANAAWMDNFRNSGSTGGGYNGGSDRGHNSFIDAVTETERYHDPNTGFDQRLEGGYDRTFTNGVGEFRQTNDPSVDPSAWQGDWTEQRPVDY